MSSFGPRLREYVNQETGRIYAAYNVCGAKSGRLSCSKPNLQQINREGLCRSGFGAPPGRILIILDYVQIELMVAAFLSEDRAMLAKPIGDLNLSVRARKCMTKLGIQTLGELLSHTGDELLECKNFGVTSLNEVREKLRELNLKLKNE